MSTLDAHSPLRSRPAVRLWRRGGGGGAAADAGLLPGAARYSLDVADLDEALVASSHGIAFPFDHFLAGQFLTVDGTETALWQATLDEDGEPVAAHRADLAGPFFSLALISGSVEHRGTGGRVLVGRPHLWGGGRQADGGWCAVIDEAGPYTIVDTVLFATGGMGALLQAADAGRPVLLAYEEYDADGTQVLAVDLPGPFLSGTICSIGLVTSPDGVSGRSLLPPRRATSSPGWARSTVEPPRSASLRRRP